ncbi:acyl-CoA carboxylase subunit beta [Cumulibacter soli]|uniref:acyl-CoA carboxylase subunit beta n=1 Tax=Cumulibacter soli TaxID=2546344 RepID=UPI001ABA6B2C|nr:carboxyl transferase domain-containing protein [Cumulibacter soli]
MGPTHSELLAELERRTYLASDEARAEQIQRQHDRGKYSARERISMLVDKDSFWEFGGLVDAARGTPDQQDLLAPADGVVTGIGRIDGRPAAIMSFDFTVFGGSNGVAGGLKVTRCCERALQDGIPLVMLLDGGGHRIQEGLDSHHFAWGFETFKEFVELSGYVPIVAAMLGPGFAGPSNFAAFADYVVMVRGISTMGIAGPALVEAATGEQTTNEELGGADLQATLGVTDLAVDSEQEAMDSVRLYLSYLPSSADLAPPRDASYEPGVTGRLRTIVPTNPMTGYDVTEVIEAIVDEATAFELKPTYAPNLVTALARLDGRPIMVVANQPLHMGGSLDSPACEKAAHAVSVADAFGLPLLFLIDIPGFLVGTRSATTQLARRSGRLMFELGQATVPRFSVVLRKGYGAGYIAMAGGRSYQADVALAWPTAEICAMSIEGAVDVAFRKAVLQADDPAQERRNLIDKFRRQVDPFLAAQGFGVDDVIDPDATRDILIGALDRAPARHKRVPVPKHHGISPI